MDTAQSHRLAFAAVSLDDPVTRRYLSGDYAEQNPDWDAPDSAWKAGRVAELLERHRVRPRSIAEVGCGAGAVLAALRPLFPEAELDGFDISPGAARFWERHRGIGIRFTLGDFLALNTRRYDLLLVLDVVEHLGDPFAFLERLRAHGDQVVFHFPLDLSALAVAREKQLLRVRTQVGHVQYFTRGLALSREVG